MGAWCAGTQATLARTDSGRDGWAHRYTTPVSVAAALAGDYLTPKAYLVRAKADTIRLAAAQLLLIHTQRRAWEKRMGALLLGAPRTRGARQPGHDQGPVVPGGEIYLSFAGLGDRLAARIAGEIGDITTFDTPNCLTHHVAYDEAVHVANRNRALAPLSQAVQQAA